MKHMIVVGAGILGASLAYHLANRGIKVTVIDKGHPASGATGSSFGWIHTTVRDSEELLSGNNPEIPASYRSTRFLSDQKCR